MTAVFTRTKSHYNSLGLFPSDKFVRIGTTQDLNNTEFNSVIVFHDHYTNRKVQAARRVLELRQPELFKPTLSYPEGFCKKKNKADYVLSIHHITGILQPKDRMVSKHLLRNDFILEDIEELDIKKSTIYAEESSWGLV